MTFLWIQTATRFQFCGHVDKLPDVATFDGTFQQNHNQIPGVAHKLPTFWLFLWHEIDITQTADLGCL